MVVTAMVFDNYNLTISSWNVHGLNSKKLKDKDFLDCIKKYDIMSLCETWTTKDRNIHIKGYNNYHIPSCGKEKGRKSGGIVVYVKKSIDQYVTCVSKDKNRVWLCLESSHFGWDKDIYLALLYCPPADSPYYTNQLESLEAEINTFSQRGKVTIVGDLNARVGELQDFILNDNDMYVPLPDDYISDQIPRHRLSCDKTVNQAGRQLIDMTIATGLRILNGRYMGDSLGQFTFLSPQGASTIDYTLCHYSLLEKVSYFIIKPITVFSDHCQIICSLKCKYNVTKDTHKREYSHYNTTLPSRPKWNQDSKSMFVKGHVPTRNLAMSQYRQDCSVYVQTLCY